MTALALLAGMLVVIIFFIWWLIFETEGVYLGRRIVVCLYDIYAERYDGIKQFDDRADFLLLSEPIMAHIRPNRAPLMLDAATGTARLPIIMARNPEFEGQVIGLDLSRKMLAVAQRKVAALHFEPFITLIRGNAQQMPFKDNRFDVVTCLEALEFMPDPKAALAEMVRVLRPGGLLLTTIRIDTRWMPDRTWSEEQMRANLQFFGMDAIEFETWQEDYSKVWALKAEASPDSPRNHH